MVRRVFTEGWKEEKIAIVITIAFLCQPSGILIKLAVYVVFFSVFLF